MGLASACEAPCYASNASSHEKKNVTRPLNKINNHVKRSMKGKQITQPPYYKFSISRVSRRHAINLRAVMNVTEPASTHHIMALTADLAVVSTEIDVL